MKRERRSPRKPFLSLEKLRSRRADSDLQLGSFVFCQEKKVPAQKAPHPPSFGKQLKWLMVASGTSAWEETQKLQSPSFPATKQPAPATEAAPNRLLLSIGSDVIHPGDHEKYCEWQVAQPIIWSGPAWRRLWIVCGLDRSRCRGRWARRWGGLTAIRIANLASTGTGTLR